MKVSVTEECISCGLCVEMCPEVFEMHDMARPKVNPVPAEYEDAAREAADACPVDAIVVEE
jgi:ferredoxin